MASTTHTRDGPPVDRDRRARLAELLRQFASGRSTNDTYEDRFFAEVFAGRPAAQHDPALFAIWSRSWLLYSDLREHRLVGRYALPAAVRRDVCRWVVFLHTNVPYEWPVKSFVAAGSCLIDLLTFGLASRVRDARARQAMEAACASPLWPFIRQADLDAALARPRLLSGRPPGRRE